MKTNLNWGGGTFDVLLDLRTGKLFPYSGVTNAAKVHENFGGKNYYQSCTGLSGAGWVPASPALKKVPTYRVDTLVPEVPPWDEFPDIVPGRGVVIPIDYATGTIPRGWPALVSLPEGIGFIMPQNVALYLAGEANTPQMWKQREFTFRSIPAPGAEAEEKSLCTYVHGEEYYGAPNLALCRQALLGIYHQELRFRWPGPERVISNPFWTRLGLHQFGGDFYKIAQGVCWAKYSPAELSTVAGLQAAAPRNVVVLLPNLYIQQVGEYEAIGLFTFNGEETEFEIRITPQEAVRAFFLGDYQDILSRLEADAIAKAAEIHAARRREAEMREEWAAKEINMRMLCEQHAHVEITISDSLDAGNCEPGTRRFGEKHFPGRESVTLGELLRFFSNPDIRRVIEKKITQIAG